MSGFETGAQWRTKGDLVNWIAARAGVDPSVVEAAHRARTEARGELWRSDDELTRVRKKAFASLRTPMRRTVDIDRGDSSPLVESTNGNPAAARARRFTGSIR
jgi:hypothetical protein